MKTMHSWFRHAVAFFTFMVTVLHSSAGHCQATAPASESPATLAGGITDPSNYFTDKSSGTVWRRCDLGTQMAPGSATCAGTTITATWPDAVALIQEINARAFEGFSDWRLPSRRDLRNLVLTAPGMREPVGTHFSLYGFGPADFHAIYEGGARVNFGGRKPGDGSNQCQLATDLMMEQFGRPNAVSVDYFSVASYNSERNHRWLSNNESWEDGSRISPETNKFQNPISINFASRCDYLLAAFFRSDKTFNLAGTLRPHASLPILVVRGGSPDRSWSDAQAAVQRKEQVLLQSQRNSAAQMAALAAIFGRIGNAVRDAMASSGGGSGSGSASVSEAPSSPNESGQRLFPYRCEFKCKGGTWHTVDSVGRSNGEAATRTHERVEQVCRAQGTVQDRGWGIDCKSK